MRRALTIAKRGRTSPNPMVGAVIVKNGRIIAEGWHKRAGEPHAEIIALKKAGQLARGADLYVTLEPCCHYGKTPPCVDAIIEAGIASVTAAMVDPNPMVAGRGIERLNAAGIRTKVGMLGDEAARLNEAFVKYITAGRPFITLKYAMTLDGKIATRTGDSKWISGEESRRLVHRIRERSDAIMVGIGTVISDNPELTARVSKRTVYPKRIVVDTHARTPTSIKMLSLPGETIIAVGESAEDDRVRKLEKAGARILKVEESNEHIDMKSLAYALGKMEITSVLLEGGGTLASAALEAGIVDKIIAFIAPKIVGGAEAITPVEGLGIDEMVQAAQFEISKTRRVGKDIMIEAYPCSQG